MQLFSIVMISVGLILASHQLLAASASISSALRQKNILVAPQIDRTNCPPGWKFDGNKCQKILTDFWNGLAGLRYQLLHEFTLNTESESKYSKFKSPIEFDDDWRTHTISRKQVFWL